MRTAEEIFEETLDGWLTPADDDKSVTLTRDDLYTVINTARKEAIEECIKIDLTSNPEDIAGKLLNLINELK